MILIDEYCSHDPPLHFGHLGATTLHPAASPKCFLLSILRPILPPCLELSFSLLVFSFSRNMPCHAFGINAHWPNTHTLGIATSASCGVVFPFLISIACSQQFWNDLRILLSTSLAEVVHSFCFIPLLFFTSCISIYL